MDSFTTTTTTTTTSTTAITITDTTTIITTKSCSSSSSDSKDNNHNKHNNITVVPHTIADARIRKKRAIYSKVPCNQGITLKRRCYIFVFKMSVYTHIKIS